jgi:hypothetical protein
VVHRLERRTSELSSPGTTRGWGLSCTRLFG